MFQLGRTLISEDIIEKDFVCNLSACKGACCVDGDAGAPLDEEEISILEDYIEEIKPYMTEEGRVVIDKVGVFDYDAAGKFVTPLVNDNECAFVYFENGVALCAIEMAWIEKKISYQKPISCHLYPIRLSKLQELTAINYHEWQVCSPAREHGEKLGLPVYKFLKDPLIRKFGEEWFVKLEKVVARESKK